MGGFYFTLCVSASQINSECMLIDINYHLLHMWKMYLKEKKRVENEVMVIMEKITGT